MKKRIPAFVLALAMLAGLCLPGLAATADDIAAQKGQTMTYVISNAPAGWMSAVALYSAGASGAAAPALPAAPSATALASTLLARLACDEPVGALPYDLAMLQKADGSFGDIYSTVYAVLALNKTLPARLDHDGAQAWLTAQQLADGGFALTGTTGDPDTTAMVLLAYEGAGVSKAVTFLKSKMTANGGYIPPWNDGKSESACSAATVISGLVARGETVDAKLVDNLLGFKLSGGAFAEARGGAADSFASLQALIALGDLVSGSSVYARLPAAEAPLFRDWTGISDWARPFVQSGFELRLFVGDNKLSFNPKVNFTKAELAAVISNMMPSDAPSPDPKLSDVKTGDWYYAHVSRVVAAGVLSGAGGKFDPAHAVTREEVALALFKHLKLSPGQNAAPKDLASVGAGYVDAVKAVMDEGIMVGDGTNFNPKSQITREEVATIFVKLAA